jgi:DNA-binding transcriptional LysR family regulator
LLERSSRRVKPTPEGVVFLAGCRRVLAGADRAARRVQAAARGEAGTLRLVAIIAACHTAGYEPKIDQHGAGATVWGYIADGRGVGLVVSSLIEQLPRGVKLVDLTPPRPMLTVNAVWRQDHELPALERLFDTVKRLAQEHHWS